MKPVTLLLAFLLTGCASMTPRQKQATIFVGTVVVDGLMISLDHSHKTQPDILGPLPNKPCPTSGKGGPIYEC